MQSGSPDGRPRVDAIRVRLVVGLVCAFVATASGVAVAQEPDIPTQRYTVREGDSCADIAARFFGSRRRHDIIHAYNPGMGPPPHDLVPGTVLVLPVRAPAAASVPDAHVTRVRRQVRSRAVDEASWRPATTGEALFRGHRVNALEESSAQVTFQDTRVVEVRENTLIVIYGASAVATRASTGTASLETGALRSRLGSLRMRIDTPTAVAELDGGSAVVASDDRGSRVSSHAGRLARVRSTAARTRTVAVRPGFGSVVRPGASPSAPRALPPSPAPTAGQPTSYAAVNASGATVRGSFEPVLGASRYRVEVLRDGNPPEVVAATEVPSSVTAYELRDVPVGTYSVTLATQDADGLEGAPGPATVIEVFQVALELPDGAAAPVPTDATRDAAAPWIVPVGTTLTLPPGYACEGSVEGRVRFDVPGLVRLACTQDGRPVVAELVVEVVGAAPPAEPATPAEPPAEPPAPTEPPVAPPAPEPLRRPLSDLQRHATDPTAMGPAARPARDVEASVGVDVGAYASRGVSTGVRPAVTLRATERVALDFAFGTRAPAAETPRGFGATTFSVGARVVASRTAVRDLGFAFDAAVVGHPRAGLLRGPLLRPSLDLTRMYGTRLGLRTRLGAVIDARASALRLATLGATFSYALASRFELGVQGDGRLGALDGDLLASLGMGAYAAAVAGPLVLSLGARVEPFDDARRFAPAYSVGLDLRLRFDVPDSHPRR